MLFGWRPLLAGSSWRALWLGGFWASLCLATVGCGPSSGPGPALTDAAIEAAPVGSIAGQPDRGMLAAKLAWESVDPQVGSERLWQAVRQRYARLPRYQDQATVQLQYELTGNRFFESMPCAVVFDRAQQRWQGRLFRTQLEGDATGWRVRIREGATHDFDQQIKQVPRDRDWHAAVSDDEVAGIYLSGATDLPLSAQAQAGLVLALPQLSWLESTSEAVVAGQGPIGTQPVPGPVTTEVHYLGWTWHRDQFCVRFATRWRGQMVELWVDPNAQLVRRMVLPTAVLQAELAEATEVRNLQFYIDFAEIGVDESVIVPASVPLSATDRLVRRFVKIPESFPSPWLGRATPAVALLTQRQTNCQLPAVGEGMTAALCLPQVEASAAWTACWQAAAERHAGDRFCLVLDAIASEMAEAARGEATATGSAATASVEVVPYGAEAWQMWGLNQGRWLVVWDKAGTLQYVGVAELDTLSATLDAVLHRVGRGDAVGQEMITDYQAFLTEYWEQLKRESLEPSTEQNR